MRIERRKFILSGVLLSLAPSIEANVHTGFDKEFNEVASIIASVQEHMFPQESRLPSAHAMKVTAFLYETIKNKHFDKDIRAFVLEGARELDKRTKGLFLTMSVKEREKALRVYEETNYGSYWLSRILTLTMEAIFSDPIYGSNIKEKGWKAIHTFSGYPRPKTKYMDSKDV